MTYRKTRVLLSIALVLVASLGLVWWLHTTREDSATNVARSAREAPRPSPTTEPNLAAPDSVGARTAEAILPEAAEPAPSPGTGAPPGLAGTGLWLRLIDDRGEPKPGIRLEVAEELWVTLGHEHPEKYCVEQVVTDASGRARIAARQPSEIEHVALTTAGGAYLVAPPPFEIAAGRSDEVLILHPEPVTIRGRVLDLSGAPVTTSVRVERECCAVAANAAGARAFIAENEVTYVDAEGRFAFETIAGWHALSAAEPGVPSSETVNVGVGAPARDADVALYIAKGERAVRVRLASTARFEPSDVWVGAVGELPWPAETRTAGVSIERLRSEQIVHAPHVDGAWRLDLPRGGTWKVRAGGVDFETALATLPPAAEEITLTLVPKPQAPVVSVSGRVVDALESPLPATVTFLRASDLGHFEEVQAGKDGAFRVRFADHGPDESLAYVYATHRGYGGRGVGPIALDRSRDDLEIVLQQALRIAGRVHGLPAGVEADVVLYSRPTRFERAEVPAASEWLPTALEGERTNTYENGVFQLRDLPAGEYELWIEPRDKLTPPARQRVSAGDEDVRVELGRGLEGGLTLLCRVVDDLSGAVVQGAEVSLRSARPGVRARGSSGLTDATGTCRLTGHAADRWFVFARAQGFAHPVERYADFTAGEQFVEVRLSPACTLDLQFRDSFGTPRSSVSVCATTLQGELLGLQDRYGNWDGDFTQSDASGRVVAGGLPAGRVRVVVGWANGARVEIANHEEACSLANPLGLLVFEHDLVPGRRAIVRRDLR